MASTAPLRMNSPYPPSGPERMVWHPTLMGFLSFRSGVAPKPRGAARAARPAAPVLRNVRRVVRREAAMACPPRRLLGGDGPGARLDLLSGVPDGNELAGVADVLERIRVEHEQVGALARLDRATVLEPQHPGASASRGGEGLHGREARAHHQLELAVLRPSRDADWLGARVGAEGDVDSGVLQRLEVLHAGGEGGLDLRRVRVVRD